MSATSRFLKKVSPGLHAWLFHMVYGPKRYKHLYKSIKKIKAKKILEIGVWNGKRAVKMIETARKLNEDVEYYGFDLFDDLSEDAYKKEMSKRPPSQDSVQNILDTTGAKITLHAGNTLESLPKAVASLPKMDFIFIDGGHSNETVKSDWEAVSVLMHKESIVIFDDYWRNRTDGGSKLTVDAIDTSLYKVEILPEIDVFDNPDFGHLEISFAKVTLR